MEKTKIENREDLKNLSNYLKEEIKLNPTETYALIYKNYEKINPVIQCYYGIEPDVELKTYKQRNKEGYSIIKGEKSYLFWSRPLKNLLSEEDKEKEENKDVLDTFGTCRLFTSNQVEKRKFEEA